MDRIEPPVFAVDEAGVQRLESPSRLHLRRSAWPDRLGPTQFPWSRTPGRPSHAHCPPTRQNHLSVPFLWRLRSTQQPRERARMTSLRRCETKPSRHRCPSSLPRFSPNLWPLRSRSSLSPSLWSLTLRGSTCVPSQPCWSGAPPILTPPRLAPLE